MRVRTFLRCHRLAFGLLAALVAAGGVAWPQAKRREPPHAAAAEAPAPFRVGEQLDYRVGWANFLTAATAHLAVTERRSFYRWNAWHFQAVARTADPLRYLFALDDQFDSYTDAATLTSHQYELYLHEQGRQATRVVRLLANHELAWGDGTHVLVGPETRDPVATLYYLRTVDWQRTPEVRVAVYDGSKLYQMRARLQTPQISVAVPAGTYAASLIDIQVLEPGQTAPAVHCSLWLAHDAARTPARMEGEVPVGTVRVELLKAVE
jgi:hypothetical protein